MLLICSHNQEAFTGCAKSRDKNKKQKTVYRDLSESLKEWQETKKGSSCLSCFKRGKSLCAEFLAHTYTHTHTKPSWRVHLVWLSYRFILIWGNVRVRRGERMCVTQETEEKDGFNRLVKLDSFLGAFQRQGKEEKSWGWLFFFPPFSHSAVMPWERGTFQRQSCCRKPSIISNNLYYYNVPRMPSSYLSAIAFYFFFLLLLFSVVFIECTLSIRVQRWHRINNSSTVNVTSLHSAFTAFYLTLISGIAQHQSGWE